VDGAEYLFEVKLLKDELLIEALVQVIDGGKYAKKTLNCLEEKLRRGST
jgi:hypothetical protein